MTTGSLSERLPDTPVAEEHNAMRKHLLSWTLCLPLLLGACSTTGHNFDGGQLAQLAPGQSTLEDATLALGALPDAIYRHPDGGLVAQWRYQVSFVTDGFYGSKSARLQFGPDGRLVRLLDSNNILLEPWARKKLLGPPQAMPDNTAQQTTTEVEFIVIPGPGETAAR